MSTVGQIERKTQDRVVRFFRDYLGYEYGGDWQDRPGNANIEADHLRNNLLARGYDEELIGKAVEALRKTASVGGVRTLYEANHEVYDLLRYGVKVKRGVGEQYKTVWAIDWDNPDANHFVIAEEVSISGEHNKRPDVVLYVNGLALGVIEFKRSKV
ncbi:MAG: type I restriction endonuclease, partial [Brevibacterium aurantiacum]